MTIEKLCNQYLHAIETFQNYKKNSVSQTLIAAICLVSYLTLIVPLAVYCISKLCGRVTKKTELSPTDVKVQSSKLQIDAEKGDAIAQKTLGWKLLHGDGVEKDEKTAVSWLKKSAIQGNAIAQDVYGYCLQHGIGTDKDEKAAVEQYRKASNQGNADAQNRLGLCLEHGVGTVKDEKGAGEQYKKASDQGHAGGQNNLGRCLLKTGKAQNLKDGRELIQKAAEKGYSLAQCNLGICYRDGIGTEKDENMAEYWLKKSADQGNEIAKNALK